MVGTGAATWRACGNLFWREGAEVIRLTLADIDARAARNRAAWGDQQAAVREVFGTLTTPPVYMVGKRNPCPRTFNIPFPPSVNTYWRNLPTGRTVLSAKAREYRKKVIALTAVNKPFLSRLRMVIELYPPDKRRRDVDNSLKAILDSLQHAGVYRDDEQIDELTAMKKTPVKGGYCMVSIFEIPSTKGNEP